MNFRRFLAALVVLVAVSSVASADPVVQGIVNQVSQSQYTHYLSDSNFLYTHNGDNRGFGPQHDLARTNIYNTLAGFGLSTTLDPFAYNSHTYYNVVATKTGAVTPGSTYIIGAHYDSVNNPGANDNASGVAAVLEAARVLSQHQFESTLVFIAFDREEQGLIGSTAYAAAHQNDNILGMLSLDMIAYRDPNNLTKAYVYSDYSAFRTAVAGAINTYGNGLTSVQGNNEYATDNWPFGAYNKPNAFLEENFYAPDPYYHKSTDSVDTPGYIDYVYATSMVKGSVGWLAQSAAVVPDWKGGNSSGPTDWGLSANWNPGSTVPNGPGTNVCFGNQLSTNNVVDIMSAGRTIGTIIFAANSSTTIQSTGGFSLTLDNSGSASTINVAGSHIIDTPVLLNNDVNISGLGTLNLSGGISGPHGMNVLSGNLTAMSISVNTLTIGSGVEVTIQALPGGPLSGIITPVPEPSTLVLLGIHVISLLAYAWRRWK
jgi:hypothetical protein